MEVRSCGIPDAPSAAGTRSHLSRPPRSFAAPGVMNAAATKTSSFQNAPSTLVFIFINTATTHQVLISIHLR
ncbi:MAG: hypothetical protein M3Z24_12405 [Chloroflexota bacterium]|nr:hypothetical protein [Chloroflexota bacterium]